jgi:hypothetical protein
MKKWYKIEEFATFKKVIFYTIREENDDFSETDKFLQKMSSDFDQQKNLDKLVAFIETMGEEFGAKQQFFRHEMSADGLPPPYSTLMKYNLFEFIEYDLRLYCSRLSDSIVILYGGGKKTALKAQDCPNVWPHFRLANAFANKMDEKIIDKTFILNYKDLVFTEEAEIEI